MEQKYKNILNEIYASVEEVNDFLPLNGKIPCKEDALLCGEYGPLDSMGLVNFIVILEDRLENNLGLSLSLMEIADIANRKSPMRTVGSLAAFIFEADV